MGSCSGRPVELSGRLGVTTADWASQRLTDDSDEPTKAPDLCTNGTEAHGMRRACQEEKTMVQSEGSRRFSSSSSCLSARAALAGVASNGVRIRKVVVSNSYGFVRVDPLHSRWSGFFDRGLLSSLWRQPGSLRSPGWFASLASAASLVFHVAGARRAADKRVESCSLMPAVWSSWQCRE